MKCVSQRADGQSFNALLYGSLDVGTCSSEAIPGEVTANPCLNPAEVNGPASLWMQVSPWHRPHLGEKSP